MTFKEFFSFKQNRYFWVNILAMVGATIVLLFLLFFFINVYTRHGKAIEVPDVSGLTAEEATKKLDHAGLEGEIMDYRYEEGVPENVVLEQKPASKAHVKAGRVIYLTVCTKERPTYEIPDIIDNCSLREAQARLKSAGFKLTSCDTIAGERDWVYGLRCNGRPVHGGDKMPEGSVLTIIIGGGGGSHSAEGSEGSDGTGDESGDNATVDDSWFE